MSYPPDNYAGHKWLCEYCKIYNGSSLDTCWTCSKRRPTPRPNYWSTKGKQGAPLAPATQQPQSSADPLQWST
eukprot:2861070-Prorocentrum_lima.AAC.1